MKYEEEFNYILNKASKLREKRLANPLSPKELKEQVDLALEESQTSTSVKKIIDNVFANSINTQNPRFLNQLFGGSTEESWLAELMTAILNTSMATYEIAPLATLMEHEVLQAINKEVKFESHKGLFVPGGSYANMLGINCARFYKNPSIKEDGNYGASRQVVFVSEDAHYSSEKAVALLGMGTKAIVKVAVDKNRKMLVSDLEDKVKEAIDSGHTPTCVVSTAGTTVWGAYDPIDEISTICERYKIWHHVDAAWGGLVFWSDRKEALLPGIEKVDSITFDFHKLMASTLTKGIFLTRHPEVLVGANSGGGSKYIFHDQEAPDIGPYSIQCGRKVDALAIWLQWKIRGTEHYRQKINELYQTQIWIIEYLKTHSDTYQLLHNPEFMNVCFQVIPPSSDIDISEYNKTLRESLMKRGNFMVNIAKNNSDGLFFRLVLNHWGITPEILKELFEEIDSIKQSIVGL